VIVEHAFDTTIDLILTALLHWGVTLSNAVTCHGSLLSFFYPRGQTVTNFREMCSSVVLSSMPYFGSMQEGCTHSGHCCWQDALQRVESNAINNLGLQKLTND